MTFTDTLWTDTSDLQNVIATMPFNTELADGTLPPETFRRYIIQDAHYLEGFARALALSAARAPDADAVAQLAGSAKGAIVVERLLHADYMDRFDVSAEDFAATPPSRACDHYVSFLIRSAAVEPFPVAVVSLLPCFWIYHKIGVMIHARAKPDNPFSAWIDTYASPDFEDAVTAMLDLTNRLAAQADEETRKAMTAAFTRASWHEWMFWESAYRGEAWDTPA
ncbi:thiaminase/transcriptional activator TenA [Sagittula marina]|uniref:Thiaminase/transcriptional activator TenA n=1 Tax=Sagittula marina TaxID=943940 RepID=A0A7W6DV71_9RHOB|nr:TenA family protein [Sagittula marina]MBB3987195.1 thiaminase/transcriptional activator TenA [Sagittula marina]